MVRAARLLLTWSRPEIRRVSWAPRTLGGDGILGAARGSGLGAVAAGALEGVPAAPLHVQLEAPRQGECQFLTGRHLLTRLQDRGQTHNPRGNINSRDQGGHMNRFRRDPRSLL